MRRTAAHWQLPRSVGQQVAYDSDWQAGVFSFTFAASVSIQASRLGTDFRDPIEQWFLRCLAEYCHLPFPLIVSMPLAFRRVELLLGYC